MSGLLKSSTEKASTTVPDPTGTGTQVLQSPKVERTHSSLYSLILKQRTYVRLERQGPKVHQRSREGPQLSSQVGSISNHPERLRWESCGTKLCSLNLKALGEHFFLGQLNFSEPLPSTKILFLPAEGAANPFQCSVCSPGWGPRTT